MPMTIGEEQLFDERFIQDYDNGGPGPLWLFRVNEDGTRSIALAQDVKDFIDELLDRRNERRWARTAAPLIDRGTTSEGTDDATLCKNSGADLAIHPRPHPG